MASESVREHIRKIIKAENTLKPYGDQEITEAYGLVDMSEVIHRLGRLRVEKKKKIYRRSFYSYFYFQSIVNDR